MPFEVPDNWVWTTLGSVCNFENGFAFSSDDYKQEGIPLIRISNISDNTIDLNGCVFVQKEIEDRFVVKNGDLLIALSGATTGKMGVYSSDKVAYLNQRVGNLRIIDTSILSPEYRNIFMYSKTETILKLAYGGAQPNISGTAICSFLFPLPPLAEQRRIVTEVDHWLTLIDLIEKEKFDLQISIKQAKNKILNLAIHGKLVPQDPNDEPAAELLKRINPNAETTCDNGHSKKLPQSWIICRLGEICKVENGYAFSRGDVEEKFIVSKGDLLIAMSGATTGKMGIYSQNEISYLNQRVGNIKILNKDLLLPEYRNYFMISKMDDILKLAYGGAQPNISAKIISNFLLPLPPISEQQRIVAKIEELFSVLDSIKKSLEA